MKRIFWVLISTLMIFGSFGALGFAEETTGPPAEQMVQPLPAIPPIEQQTFSLQQLTADYDQLKRQIMSKNPLLFTNKVELMELFTSQAGKLFDGMTELQFYRVLSPIIAKIACGHTMIQHSKDYENYLVSSGRFLPFEIKLFNNRAYVMQNLSEALIPVGAEIVSINEKPVTEIVGVFLNNLPADAQNLSRKYYLINRNFSLYYYRYIESVSQFRIVYIDPQDQQSRSLLINALTLADQKQINLALQSPPPSPEPAASLPNPQLPPPVAAPLYAQRLEAGYGVLTIKSFAFYENHSQLRFLIDRFFKEVAAKKLSHVVLDLRGNGGGNPLCTAHLFSYLIAGPTSYYAKDNNLSPELTMPVIPAPGAYKGKLYVLINGGSSSETAHLVSLLKYHKIGTLVGEEMGGTFIYADLPEYLTLDHTKLRLRTSTRELKTAVTGLEPGRGIIPDLIIRPNAVDVIGEKDTELNYIIRLIQKDLKMGMVK